MPHSSVGKESACNVGDPSSIPGSGRFAEEGIGYPLQYSWASLVAHKNLPAMWETWVQSLGWEDPLDKGKAITPVFWPGEFHGLYSPWGSQRVIYDKWLSLTHSLGEWLRASLIAQVVKNLPAMQETPVQFLGWEYPLEKE